MSRLSDAWEAAELALREVTPYPHAIKVYPSLPFIVPYRARARIEYRPEGHKRNRNDDVQGEGLTVTEALEDLTTQLREYATSGRYDHEAEMAKWREQRDAEGDDEEGYPMTEPRQPLPAPDDVAPSAEDPAWTTSTGSTEAATTSAAPETMRTRTTTSHDHVNGLCGECVRFGAAHPDPAVWVRREAVFALRGESVDALNRRMWGPMTEADVARAAAAPDDADPLAAALAEFGIVTAEDFRAAIGEDGILNGRLRAAPDDADPEEGLRRLADILGANGIAVENVGSIGNADQWLPDLDLARRLWDTGVRVHVEGTAPLDVERLREQVMGLYPKGADLVVREEVLALLGSAPAPESLTPPHDPDCGACRAGWTFTPGFGHSVPESSTSGETPPDFLAAKDRSMAEHSDTRSECPRCGEWRDSPTSDCAACGASHGEEAAK